MSGARKPLRWPRFWLGLFWLAVAVVWAGCLLPSPDVALPQGSDKLEHALAYFLLAASGVQLWRGWRALAWLALGLLTMGAAIEVAQATLTASRQADGVDLLADAVGIVAGIALALTPMRDLLLRWFPARAG